jgi:signal transduction histidine kinase
MNYNNERLNIFFKNQWLSMGGVAVPTFIVLYLLLKDDKIYLFSSFALVVLTFIPRIMIMKKYQKTLNEKLEQIYSIWVLLSSVITSLIILYFYPKGDFELISLLVAYLAGMTAGAITTLGSSLIIYRLYAIPQLLTLSLSLLYYGNNERYYLLALSVIVYMAIMLKTSKNYYENLIGKIKLEETLYENLRFKSIDNILDTISHKINNPLSIVFMSIDGLKRKNLKEDEKEKYIRYIEDASNRVSSLGNIYDEFKTDQISLVKNKYT